MLQIYCKNTNSTKSFPEGSSLLTIYTGFNLQMPYGPVSAKVNNKVESLDFRVYYNKDVEFLNITSASGMRTYVRSLCFVLVKAVEELYPEGSISLEHPVSKGYYCNLHLDRGIGLDDVMRIKQKMQEIIHADILICAWNVTPKRWYVCFANAVCSTKPNCWKLPDNYTPITIG